MDNHLHRSTYYDTLVTSSNKSIGAKMDNVEYQLIARVDGEDVYSVTRFSTVEIEEMFERAETAVEIALNNKDMGEESVFGTEAQLNRAMDIRDEMREDGRVL